MPDEVIDTGLVLRAQLDPAGVILRVIGVLPAVATLPRRLRALLRLPSLRGLRALIGLALLRASLLVRSLRLAVAPLRLPVRRRRGLLRRARLRVRLAGLPIARLARVLTGGGGGITWGILLVIGALLSLSTLLTLSTLPVLSTLLSLSTLAVVVILRAQRVLLVLSTARVLVVGTLLAADALLALSPLQFLRTLLVAALLRRHALGLTRRLRLLIVIYLIYLPSLIRIAALIDILRAGCGHAECKRDRRGAGQIVSPHGGSLFLSRLVAVAGSFFRFLVAVPVE